MREKAGRPLPLGVTIEGNVVNFSTAVPQGKECQLLLYRVGENEPCMTYEMKQEIGEVRYLALEDITPSDYEYNYQIDDEIVIDPYAKALTGRGIWGEERDTSKSEVRGILYDKEYDWEGDKPLELPYHSVIAYSLHVRGFTKHPSSKVRSKGTFRGVIEKLTYLQNLGINQIHCMPVYDFEENLRYRNYWGYGEGYFLHRKHLMRSQKMR